MRAQMKRVFAMLLTAMLVIDSQSSACSSLVSFGAGARNVLAADITEENIDDVDPGSVENVVVTAGDTVSVDFADGAAEDDTSYNEVNEADDDKGDEDAEDAADNEDASVEEDQSVSEDPVSANAFEIQESDTEMTESDLSAASGQEDQSSEEQFEEQTAEGSEAAAADASISDPENTGDEQDDLSIDMPEQTDEEDAAPAAENPEGYEDGGYSEDFEDAENPEDTENYEEAGDSDGSENYEDPGASGDSENYEDAGDQDESFVENPDEEQEIQDDQMIDEDQQTDEDQQIEEGEDTSSEAVPGDEGQGGNNADQNQETSEQAAEISDPADSSAASVTVTEPAENPEPVKKVYEYTDRYVYVKARLERADAVPDDAELVVTPVTVESTDYNYDAYMDALNQDPEKEYTSENTLLYDIAFMIDEKDADGNLTGKKVEFTPAAGDVNVSIRFKKNQLKNELGVETAEDIEVIHLPLENEVKEAFDSTAEATEITADNIIVQEVENQKVDVNKETVGFRTTDFSVFAFTVDFHYEGKDYSIPGSTQVLLSELIQNLHITVDGTSDGSILDVLQVKEVLFTNEELVKTEKVSGVITYQAEEGLRENVDVGEQDFLITSKKSFASDEIMTIILMDGRVLKVNVTDAQNALDVSVVLYDYDDQTTITIPSDITSDNIVLVVWVGDNGDISTTTGDIPWKVVDMNGIKGQNTPYNITIDSFNRQAWSQDGAISYSSLTPEQKANIKARLVHSTKSVSEFNLGALQNRFWNESEYTTIWNGGFDGFGMSVDHVTGLVTEGRYEINLKKANRNCK